MNGVKARAFADTNVFVYLYSQADEFKRGRAYYALSQYDRQISTQVLNEFSHVCIKKYGFTPDRVQGLHRQICLYCDMAYIYESTIERALTVHGKYGYAYYDSLIIASALEGDCQYLLSEDMTDGQVIEKRLTIRNIFAHENS
jgi:predicted nucleic acid-binding protein